MPNPFGIELGSTPDHSQATYWVKFSSVAKPHPSLVDYRGEWHPKYGLVSVSATSEIFENDPYATSALSLYETLKRQLVRVYGGVSEFELVSRDAIYTEASEFVSSLERGDRVHSCIWNRESGANLDSGISEITLDIFDAGYDATQVNLRYSVFEAQSRVDEQDETGITVL